MTACTAIAAALLLGFAIWAVRPLRGDSGMLRNIEAEWLCLRNFMRFWRRHPRYFLVTLGLAKASLGNWRRRRVLRTGFCFLQAVDDLLDGDRRSEREPLEVVSEAADELRTGVHGEKELSRLASIFRLDILEAGGEEALETALELIGVMQEDRRRVTERRLLDREELGGQSRRTFVLSLDIMLIAGRAELRAHDVPLLVELFGWCNTVRDLEEDLGKGLVNIPIEIVEEALSDGAEDMSFSQLVQRGPVRRWLHLGHLDAANRMERCEAELWALRGRNGHRVLSLFAKEIRRYVDRRFEAIYGPLGHLDDGEAP
jgi:hypothetical protein